MIYGAGTARGRLLEHGPQLCCISKCTNEVVPILYLLPQVVQSDRHNTHRYGLPMRKIEISKGPFCPCFYLGVDVFRNSPSSHTLKGSEDTDFVPAFVEKMEKLIP